MSDSTPLPPLTSLIPHHVSRDPPFDGDDNHPLPIVPDASIGGGCGNDRLKACIVAASESVWGNRDVSRDPPFNGDDNRPLPIVLDASIGDRTTAATTAGAATAGRCDDDCLKACIVATSTSVWGVPDMFPAQLTFPRFGQSRTMKL